MSKSSIINDPASTSGYAMKASSETANIGSMGSTLNQTYFEGLKKGTSFFEKAGAVGNIASTAVGTYRVFAEEEAHEKVHGAVQAIAPIALTAAKAAAAVGTATWAAPAVAAIWAINTVWDLFD